MRSRAEFWASGHLVYVARVAGAVSLCGFVCVAFSECGDGVLSMPDSSAQTVTQFLPGRLRKIPSLPQPSAHFSRGVISSVPSSSSLSCNGHMNCVANNVRIRECNDRMVVYSYSNNLRAGSNDCEAVQVLVVKIVCHIQVSKTSSRSLPSISVSPTMLVELFWAVRASLVLRPAWHAANKRPLESVLPPLDDVDFAKNDSWKTEGVPDILQEVGILLMVLFMIGASGTSTIRGWKILSAVAVVFGGLRVVYLDASESKALGVTVMGWVCRRIVPIAKEDTIVHGLLILIAVFAALSLWERRFANRSLTQGPLVNRSKLPPAVQTGPEISGTYLRHETPLSPIRRLTRGPRGATSGCLEPPARGWPATASPRKAALLSLAALAGAKVSGVLWDPSKKS